MEVKHIYSSVPCVVVFDGDAVYDPGKDVNVLFDVLWDHCPDIVVRGVYDRLAVKFDDTYSIGDELRAIAERLSPRDNQEECHEAD